MKVLFIAPAFPVPAHSGGAIATLETLRSIHSLCEVHLLVPPPESDRAANEAQLHRLLPDISVDFYSSREVQPTRLEMYTTAAKSTVDSDTILIPASFPAQKEARFSRASFHRKCLSDK